MTRSNDPHGTDNPFGDLPEWRERRRLQESQEQAYGAPAPHGNGDGQVPVGYDHAGSYEQHSGGPRAGYSDQPYQGGGQYYPEQGYAPAPSGQVDYGHYQGGESPYSAGHSSSADYDFDASRYHGHAAAPHPAASPAPQYSEPPIGYGQHDAPANYQAGTSVPPDYSASHQAPVEPRFRGGQFDQTPSHAPVNYQAVPGASPADLNYGAGVFNQAGQSAPPNPFDALPGEAERVPEGWNAGALGAQGEQQGQTGFDEDAYYDEEEEDDQRYSWKLLAAVVITGAVVTGGGFVLYDSFMGGGGGPAPIIRADKGPAKTEPADPGGRQFPHRDSKLLGRLDNSGGTSSSSRTGGNPDNPNRVRSVPTVKIGRDGRLILPNPPQQVANSGAATAASTPGINVVDSLNGQSNGGGFGALPPAVPKTQNGTASAQPTVAPARTVNNATAAPRVPKSSAAQPVIKNRGATNRATQASREPPPVPGKSAVGSGWRMTGAQAAAQKRPQVNRIEPTIARPVNPLATASNASTLGARSVSPRGYVAVLATEPTRVKALESFAELQQKHPGALQSQVPDIQRTDLKARGLGIMYRVVVGPSGSRTAANAVCASLKAEGYRGCWVKAN